jgi:hypothetical protein
MASTFSLDHAYTPDPATLLAVLTDVDYIEQKLVALDFGEVAATADGDRVTIRRTTEPPIPGFAKKVLGSRQRVVEHQTWQAGAAPTGAFEAAAAGTPVTITGTFAIDPDGSGSILRIRGAVDVKVPLVGGKIADLVADQTAKTLEREYAFTQAWIAAH